MTVVELVNGILTGLTADTKPTTYPNGTIFLDTQTGARWMYISSAWVQITAPEASLTLSNMIGPLSVAKGGTGVATLTGIPIASGTSAFTAVTAPAGTIVGTTDSQTITNKIVSTGSSVDAGVAGIETLPDIQKHGTFWGISSVSPASGIWQGFISNTVVGTGVYSNIVTDSGGTRGRWTTGTTTNSICGTKVLGVMIERDLNPYTKWKMSFPTAITTLRWYIGLMSTATAPVSSADWLANLSGVGFYYSSAVDANVHIMQNDGSASSDITTIANVGAADTSAHTYEIKAVNASAKFQYSYDGGAFTDISTKIPAATTDLTWQWFAECLTGSAARTMDVWYAYGKWDP